MLLPACEVVRASGPSFGCRERCSQFSSDLDFRLLVESMGQRCFLGDFPAVLNERLLGDCGFVHSQMEYLLPFLEFRGKSLNVHPFLPKSRSYFARQSGALGDPKLKLFYPKHDLNCIYETRRLKGMSIPFLSSSK